MAQQPNKIKTLPTAQTFNRDDLILARLSDLKDDIREVKADIREVKADIREVKADINKTNARVDKLDERFDKQNERLDERFEQLRKDLRSTIWHSELMTVGVFGIAVAVIVFVFTHIK